MQYAFKVSFMTATERPTTSSRPSNPLSASSLAPQIRLCLTIARVYKLYLFTYLLTYS